MSHTDTVLAAVIGAVLLVGGAALGWGLRTGLDRRATRRRRDFLGLPDGADSVLVTAASGTGQGLSAPWPEVYALLELGALVRTTGSRPALVSHARVAQGVGTRTEFCLGAPPANTRTAAHLGWKLPGITFTTEPADPAATGADKPAAAAGGPLIQVGGKGYRGEPGSAEYVLVAKASATDGGRPVFLFSGQTPVAHHAAVRWFADRQLRLARRYGMDGDFSLLLRVVNSTAYGPDVVELVADVTDAARGGRAVAKKSRQTGKNSPEKAG